MKYSESIQTNSDPTYYDYTYTTYNTKKPYYYEMQPQRFLNILGRIINNRKSLQLKKNPYNFFFAQNH